MEFVVHSGWEYVKGTLSAHYFFVPTEAELSGNTQIHALFLEGILPSENCCVEFYLDRRRIIKIINEGSGARDSEHKKKKKKKKEKKRKRHGNMGFSWLPASSVTSPSQCAFQTPKEGSSNRAEMASQTKIK